MYSDGTLMVLWSGCLEMIHEGELITQRVRKWAEMKEAR